MSRNKVGDTSLTMAGGEKRAFHAHRQRRLADPAFEVAVGLKGAIGRERNRRKKFVPVTLPTISIQKKED